MLWVKLDYLNNKSIENGTFLWMKEGDTIHMLAHDVRHIIFKNDKFWIKKKYRQFLKKFLIQFSGQKFI